MRPILRTAILALVWLAGLPLSLTAAEDHWVATWSTAIEPTVRNDLPPVPLADKTLRQYVRVSIPGRQVRLRLSNAYGDGPVQIRAAKIARVPDEESIGGGAIDPSTAHELSFRGQPGAVIPQGRDLVSDPIEFEAAGDLAIDLYFGSIGSERISGHRGSRTDSVIVEGDRTGEAELPSTISKTRWYLIQAVEVQAEPRGRVIAILGDSITDGLGSTTNRQNRWPDLLAKRLAANPETEQVAVGNMGIGGNAIFGGLGPAGVDRFERDVLGLAGVRYFLLFEGVNDIGGWSDADAAERTQDLIAAYQDLAARAKERGLKAYAATITPLGGYHTEARESARQTINSYIRDNTDFDAAIDFDAAVRDPDDPEIMRDEFSLDGLHLNPVGLQALADAVDLGLFTP